MNKTQRKIMQVVGIIMVVTLVLGMILPFFGAIN